MVCCLMINSLMYLANNKEVEILANSAGCIPIEPMPIQALAPFMGGIKRTIMSITTVAE